MSVIRWDVWLQQYNYQQYKHKCTVQLQMYTGKGVNVLYEPNRHNAVTDLFAYDTGAFGFKSFGVGGYIYKFCWIQHVDKNFSPNGLNCGSVAAGCLSVYIPVMLQLHDHSSVV